MSLRLEFQSCWANSVPGAPTCCPGEAEGRRQSAVGNGGPQSGMMAVVPSLLSIQAPLASCWELGVEVPGLYFSSRLGVHMLGRKGKIEPGIGAEPGLVLSECQCLQSC